MNWTTAIVLAILAAAASGCVNPETPEAGTPDEKEPESIISEEGLPRGNGTGPLSSPALGAEFRNCQGFSINAKTTAAQSFPIEGPGGTSSNDPIGNLYVLQGFICDRVVLSNGSVFLNASLVWETHTNFTPPDEANGPGTYIGPVWSYQVSVSHAGLSKWLNELGVASTMASVTAESASSQAGSDWTARIDGNETILALSGRTSPELQYITSDGADTTRIVYRLGPEPGWLDLHTDADADGLGIRATWTECRGLGICLFDTPLESKSIPEVVWYLDVDLSFLMDQVA